MSRLSVLLAIPLLFDLQIANSSRTFSFDDCYIACRYDDLRFAFKIIGLENAQTRRERQEPIPWSNPLPDPVTALSGMSSLSAMDDAFWKKHTDWLPGDFDASGPWFVDIGSGKTLRGKIERLVLAQVGCETAIVAMGKVASEDEEEYRTLAARYYVTGPESLRNPGKMKAVVLPGISVPSLTAAEHDSIETVLRKELAHRLTETLRGSEKAYQNLNRLGEPNPWPDIDDRLSRGEGNLTFDVQSVPTGEGTKTRYFVRGRWTLKGREVYLLTAWFRPESIGEAEAVISNMSNLMRESEFRRESHFSPDFMGMILNVFDCNGDGWNEVLIGRRYYEGFSMELLEFTSKGLTSAGLRFGWGC